MEQPQNPQPDSTAPVESEIEQVKQKIARVREQLEPPKPNPPLTVKIAAYIIMSCAIAGFIRRYIDHGAANLLLDFVSALIGFSFGSALLRLERSSWKWIVWTNIIGLAFIALVTVLIETGVCPAPRHWKASDSVGITSFVAVSFLLLFLLFTPSSRRAFKEWEERHKSSSTKPV